LNDFWCVFFAECCGKWVCFFMWFDVFVLVSEENLFSCCMVFGVRVGRGRGKSGSSVWVCFGDGVWLWLRFFIKWFLNDYWCFFVECCGKWVRFLCDLMFLFFWCLMRIFFLVVWCSSVCVLVMWCDCGRVFFLKWLNDCWRVYFLSNIEVNGYVFYVIWCFYFFGVWRESFFFFESWISLFWWGDVITVMFFFESVCWRVLIQNFLV
jgi:hypothetical protein